MNGSKHIELANLSVLTANKSLEDLYDPLEQGINQDTDPLISGNKTVKDNDNDAVTGKILVNSEENEMENEQEEFVEVWRNVQWKGNQIQVYPLDYQQYSIVKWQVIACLIMFIVFGFNDQSMGALIPTLIEEYNISQVKASNIFLIQLIGYTSASLLNEKIHSKFGMRGGMLIAASICIVFFVILSLRPSSFIIYAFSVFPLGLAIGILDASGNVLIGNLLVHKNEIMGIMHAIYGAAATCTPPIVTHFDKWGHWSFFFLIPLALSIIGMIIIIPSFKYETALKYDYICNTEDNQSENIDPNSKNKNNEKESFFQLFQMPAICLYSIFLFAYLGAEINTGAWFFTYLLQTKSEDRIKMAYVSSSFWIGLTSGRLVLGFVTKRVFVNEYRGARTYSLLTLIFYTLFVFVGLINSTSNLYFGVMFIIMFACGFFIGPLFPSGSIVALQVLPARLHVSGIGIAVALGGCGGAALPYLCGILLHIMGIQYFPFLSTILVASFAVVWFLYPRYIKDHPEYL